MNYPFPFFILNNHFCTAHFLQMRIDCGFLKACSGDDVGRGYPIIDADIVEDSLLSPENINVYAYVTNSSTL